MEGIRTSFPDLTVSGTVHRFGHLVPFVHTLPSTGRDGADLRVRVSFQSHVFCRTWSNTDGACHLRDEAGQPRTFCNDRFALSLTLPDFCRQMLTQNYLTWVSEDRNRASNMAVIDPPLQTGEHDTVIYYLFPSSLSDTDVELVIKSAYRKSLNFDHIKRRHNIISLVKKCYYEQRTVPKSIKGP